MVWGPGAGLELHDHDGSVGVLRVLAGELLGVATRGRMRAGTALVARGEFSIVIAGLAVTSADATEIGELAAGYVLLLAIAGPVLARYAEPLARPFERTATVRASPEGTASPG